MRVCNLILLACVLVAVVTSGVSGSLIQEARRQRQRTSHTAHRTAAAAKSLSPDVAPTDAATEVGDHSTPSHGDESTPAVSASSSTPTLSFPLRRHEKYTTAQRVGHLRKLASHHKSLMKKQNKRKGKNAISTSTRSDSTTSTTTLSLLNVYDTEWLGDISVGTPAQTFSVIFDTGSTDLWLPSTDCDTTECASQNRFDSSASSTFVDLNTNVAAAFGSGDLFGTLGKDTLYIGNVTVTSQTFCLISTEEGSWTSANDPFDGLAGLAFPALSDTGSGTPVFDSLINLGVLDRNEVSFFFGSYDQEDQASITFGTPPSSLYSGSITYIEVTEQLYWQVNFKDIYVDGVALNLCEGVTCIGILDTGTTLLTAPTSAVLSIVSAISANTDCSNFDSLPSITYVFADSTGTTFEFDLEPYYYIMDETWMGSDYCAPAIMSFDVSPYLSYYIIGDIFMRKYFTTYYRGDSTSDTAYIGIAVGQT